MTLRGRIEQLAYSAATAAKVGWYGAQYVASRHCAGPLTTPGHVPPASRRPFDPAAPRQAFLQLLRDEARDIGDGVYRLPREYRRLEDPLTVLRRARDAIAEVRQVTDRRFRKGGGVEVRATAPADLPAYYRQNFHFQSGGWLTDASAEIYETQVEALFTGSAAAMRRRVLPALKSELSRLRQIGITSPGLIDLGTGTGAVLEDIADNSADVRLTALDLSPNYLGVARRRLGARATYIEAAAEAIPLADSSTEMAMSVYLFHELPPKVREVVAREIVRILRPGGVYFHVDTVQYGDTHMDGLLEVFPHAVHEPYYEGYLSTPLSQVFAPAGLTAERDVVGFLTKLTVMRKPDA